MRKLSVNDIVFKTFWTIFKIDVVVGNAYIYCSPEVFENVKMVLKTHWFHQCIMLHIHNMLIKFLSPWECKLLGFYEKNNQLSCECSKLLINFSLRYCSPPYFGLNSCTSVSDMYWISAKMVSYAFPSSCYELYILKFYEKHERYNFHKAMSTVSASAIWLVGWR